MKSICLRGKIQLLAHLFAPCEFTEKCFAVFNQSNHVIYLTCYRSLFSRDFLLSFLLWYHFKILVKSRGGGTTFLCLASSVNIWLKYFFFNWKLNILSFIFLIWMEQFWIWFSQKSTKKCQNLHHLLRFSLF